MSNIKHLRLVLVIISFLIITLDSTQYLHAQVENDFASAGTFEIGGNITYQDNTTIIKGETFTSYNYFSFSPYIGYFIVDNFELGLNPLGIQKSWNSQDGFTTINVLFAPAYNMNIGESAFYFMEAQAGYTTQIITGTYASLNPRKKGFSWGGRTGIKIIISGKSLLNVGLQYQEITLTPKNEPKRSGSDVFMFSLGFSIWL